MDLTFENELSLRNTAFLLHYARCHPVVVPLVYTARAWSQAQQLAINSYSLILLCIAVLQVDPATCVLPPYCPVLRPFRSPRRQSAPSTHPPHTLAPTLTCFFDGVGTLFPARSQRWTDPDGRVPDLMARFRVSQRQQEEEGRPDLEGKAAGVCCEDCMTAVRGGDELRAKRVKREHQVPPRCTIGPYDCSFCTHLHAAPMSSSRSAELTGSAFVQLLQFLSG